MRKKHSFELDNQPKSHFGFVQFSALIIWWSTVYYISRSQKCWCTRSVPHPRESMHPVSISSIVLAVCTWFVRDLRPVAKIKGGLCLPAYLKTLALSTWRTSACVPTLTKNAVIGPFRVLNLSLSKWGHVHNFSWENDCYLHENEKSFSNQRPRGTWKWSIANYNPWITFIKIPTKFPMTLCSIRS